MAEVSVACVLGVLVLGGCAPVVVDDGAGGSADLPVDGLILSEAMREKDELDIPGSAVLIFGDPTPACAQPLPDEAQLPATWLAVVVVLPQSLQHAGAFEDIVADEPESYVKVDLFERYPNGLDVFFSSTKVDQGKLGVIEWSREQVVIELSDLPPYPRPPFEPPHRVDLNGSYRAAACP